MQSTNSEYGSPYLAVCHITQMFKLRNVPLFPLNELISNVMPTTGIKKVGTRATKG